MNSLRAKGWVCSRSAMSHGPVDIFAAKSGRVLLIQVKSGSARVKTEELRLLRSYASAFNAKAQVWSFRKRGEIQKVTVSNRKTIKRAKLAVENEETQSVTVSTVPLISVESSVKYPSSIS